MSYITARGEVLHQDRPGFTKLPDRFSVGDTVKPIATIFTRPGETGRVDWSWGNQAVILFADGKRYHYWRHELERAE
jgi:hypothetical protein